MHRPLIGVAALAGVLAVVPGRGAQLPDRGARRLCVRLHGHQRPDPAALEKCSCSIDVISSIIPFEEYEAGETVLRMRQVRGGGEKMALFTETAVAKGAVDRLRRAQIEAELRCF